MKKCPLFLFFFWCYPELLSWGVVNPGVVVDVLVVVFAVVRRQKSASHLWQQFQSRVKVNTKNSVRMEMLKASKFKVPQSLQSCGNLFDDCFVQSLFFFVKNLVVYVELAGNIHFSLENTGLIKQLVILLSLLYTSIP